MMIPRTARSGDTARDAGANKRGILFHKENTPFEIPQEKGFRLAVFGLE